MGTPSQDRAIDPFSSYASDNVNKLSRGVSKAQDGILTVSDLVVTSDSTSPLTKVVVNPGFAYISDVLLQVTSSYTLDFADGSEYLIGTGMTPNGYYHVVLTYDYQKSRPAPVAKIQIVDSDNTPHPSLGDSVMFLAAVRVNGGAIVSIHNYDPDNPTVKRTYIKLDVSAQYDKPTFSSTRDRGRILYETSVNKYWFGFEDRWEEISAGVSININTDATGLVVGSLAYIDSAGNAALADSTGGISTRAEMVILEVGTTNTGNGRARLAGVIDTVLVDSAAVVGIGDVLYLSPTMPGRCTGVKPTGAYQVIGRAMTAGSVTTPIQVLFFPGDLMATALYGSITAITDWTFDGVNYYHDIDISSLEIPSLSVLVDTWKNNILYDVLEVEIRNSGDTLRITEAANTNTIDYIISVGGGAGGGSGSGGGGGSSSHALLSNLDYASAGHTGFAPSPHDNTQHVSTYITSASVTWYFLNANGSVGTGASQVAAGNHVHTAYDTVPAGYTILFKHAYVPGYTLAAVADQYVVMLGNTTGGGGSWTQPDATLTLTQMPNHTHSVPVSVYTGSGYPGWDGTGDAYTYGPSGLVTSHPYADGVAAPHHHGSSWRPQFQYFCQQTKN